MVRVRLADGEQRDVGADAPRRPGPRRPAARSCGWRPRPARASAARPAADPSSRASATGQPLEQAHQREQLAAQLLEGAAGLVLVLQRPAEPEQRHRRRVRVDLDGAPRRGPSAGSCRGRAAARRRAPRGAVVELRLAGVGRVRAGVEAREVPVQRRLGGPVAGGVGDDQRGVDRDQARRPRRTAPARPRSPRRCAGAETCTRRPRSSRTASPVGCRPPQARSTPTKCMGAACRYPRWSALARAPVGGPPRVTPATRARCPVVRTRPGLAPLALVIALLAALLAAPLLPVEAAPATKPLTIEVLSNRADLVSGGDALVAVRLPARRRARQRRGHRRRPRRHRAVRGAAPTAGSRRWSRGLRSGRNVVRATAPGYAGRTRRHQPPQRRPDLLRPAARRPTSARRPRWTRSATSRRRTPSSTSPPTRRSRACSPTTATTRRRTSPPRPPTRASRCRSSSAARTASRTATATRSSRCSARARRGSPGRRRSSGTTRCWSPTAATAGRRTPRATRGSTTTPAPSRRRPGLRAELRRRARQGLRGAVDGAQQHRAQLQPRAWRPSR